MPEVKARLLKKFEDEIQQLDKELKTELPREIKRARELGDLRENAEYHAAKEKQGHIEGRINHLNGLIAHAEVIDVSKFKGTDKVLFGATVELLDSESEKKVMYRIVGDFEADIKKRWISVTSPVARGLIGKTVGDSATIQSPGGVREYEILKVVFEDAE